MPRSGEPMKLTKRLSRTLYPAVGWCVALLAALPMAALCVMAMRHSAAFDHGTFQSRLSVVAVPLLPTLLLALGIGAVIAGAGALTARAKWGEHMVTGVCALLTMLLGVLWTLSLRGTPVDDQLKVWQIASALADGTTEGMDFDYLIMFPYQSTMAVFLLPMAWLSGGTPYPIFGLFNALCAGLCVPALCRIAGLLCPRPGVKSCCALLCLAFFPLALISGFLYASLAATCLALWGMYGVLRLCAGGPARFWLLTICLPLAVVAYNGMLLFSAAAFCLLTAEGLFGGKRHGLLARVLPAVLLLVVSLLAVPATQTLFTALSGVQLGEGIPKSAWFVMGLTATDTNSGPGGFNSYTRLLFWNNGADTQATNAAALADLRAYLDSWRTSAQANLGFLHGKIQTEWLDPWFGALTGSYHPQVDQPGGFSALLCGGGLLNPAEIWLRSLLPLVYGAGAAGGIGLAVRHRGCVWRQGMAVCFLACFLFQIVYENQSRYCFPYFLCLLPMAAACLAALARKGARRMGHPGLTADSDKNQA